MHAETAVLQIEPMSVSVTVPVGWELTGDPDENVLGCIAPDELDDGGYRASITIERKFPVEGFTQLQQLAAGSLLEMEADYDGFRLLTCSEDPEGESIVRVYEFDLTELGDRRVRQVQGLLGKGALFVVNATAPLRQADELQPLFEHVIASVTPL